jgi:hypothetical protein
MLKAVFQIVVVIAFASSVGANSPAQAQPQQIGQVRIIDKPKLERYKELMTCRRDPFLVCVRGKFGIRVLRCREAFIRGKCTRSCRPAHGANHLHIKRCPPGAEWRSS